MVLIDGHESTWISRFRTAVGDESTVKLSFLHMNLNMVPWKLLLLNNRSQNQHQHEQQESHKNNQFFHHHHHHHPRKWQTVEVIDCSRIESGLANLLTIQVERLYISNSILLSRLFGQILGLGLWESKSLRELHLSSCTWTLDAMREFVEGVRATSLLEELDLSYTTWNRRGQDNEGDICVLCFALGLVDNQTIKCLKLSRCRLSDSQVASLVEFGLRNHTCMKELHLGGNTMKQRTMEALSTWLPIPSLCQLTVLDLSNPLNNNDPENYLQILLPALSQNKTIQFLNLASNKLEDDHVENFALAIGKSCITTLDLKSNKFTDAGIVKLAENLPPGLERLWLQGNPFGAEGAQALCMKIQDSHVQMVDLRIPTYSLQSSVQTLMEIQNKIHFYETLNKGGRRILMTKHDVPLGLWPLVLERANKMTFANSGCDENCRRLDVILMLIRGPVLLDTR